MCTHNTVRDREKNPDYRAGMSKPRYAVECDKGFQAPFVLGEGDTPEKALQNAQNQQEPDPRKPSYEELEVVVQTREHIDLVRTFLRVFAVELLKRGETHDRSKLDRAEVDTFTEYTPRLKDMTYGSDEYRQCLKNMAPALKHHYRHNRHHPEFHEGGIKGMDLLDLIEMFVDWKASIRRHEDGDLARSIEINKKRFQMSDDLTQIFHNTMRNHP